MVRTTLTSIILLCGLALTGCGKSNDAIAQEMVDALTGLATAAESGDKDKINAAVTKLTEVVKEHKDKKLSASEKKRIDEKYLPQIQQISTRLQTALTKAVASGKMTQQEIMSIAQTMMQLK